MPGRVLGSDKDYVSSEEGSRDPRKGTGVTVQASLRRRGVCNTTGPLSQSPLLLAHFVKPGKPLPILEERKGRGAVCN